MPSFDGLRLGVAPLAPSAVARYGDFEGWVQQIAAALRARGNRYRGCGAYIRRRTGDGAERIRREPGTSRERLGDHHGHQRTVGTPIAVGTAPRDIAITPDGTRAYVANSGSANVSVIDTATNALWRRRSPVGD